MSEQAMEKVQVGDFVFKFEILESVPPDVKNRYGQSKWTWLRERLAALHTNMEVLRVECPNKQEADKARSAAGNMNQGGKVRPKAPDGFRVRTAARPAPGSRNGTYEAWFWFESRDDTTK